MHIAHNQLNVMRTRADLRRFLHPSEYSFKTAINDASFTSSKSVIEYKVVVSAAGNDAFDS